MMNPGENKNHEARTDDSTRNTPPLGAASTKQNGGEAHERKTEFLLHKNQTRFTYNHGGHHPLPLPLQNETRRSDKEPKPPWVLFIGTIKRIKD
jgi:hypothetical protein